MTYRSGQSGSTKDGDSPDDGIELLPVRQLSRRRDNDIEIDINPDSDASLLRRHFATHDEDGVVSSELSGGLVKWLKTIMSRSPLLQSSEAQSASSYAAVSDSDLLDPTAPRRNGWKRKTTGSTSRHPSLASGVGFTAMEGGSRLEDIASGLSQGDEEDQDIHDWIQQEATVGEENPPDNSP